MEIKRLLTNLCSKNLEKSKDFYISLFSLKVDYESDWFIHLISEGRELELGIINPDNDIVPKNVSGGLSGMYLTFVVDDVVNCSYHYFFGENTMITAVRK